MTQSGRILVFNAGSSSIKFALFDSALERVLSGAATEIGGAGWLTVGVDGAAAGFADHEAALAAIFSALRERDIRLPDLACAAHRVVHGGRKLSRSTLVTDDVADEIEACNALAPLHNPHNLAVIRAVAAVAPALPQVASFDTAFHATNPEVALRYALPGEYDAAGIRRYGFHGISYAGLVRQLPDISGKPLPKRLLALHLGNGASLCAIREGRSVATTMGYSPLEGLTMGTRTGEIDGNAVLRLASELGIEKTGTLLNRESGLLALGGRSDMRALQESGSDRARFAIGHFCYWAIRHAGSMIAAMGGLDALAFTGGIGENDGDVRSRIMEGLSWLGLEISVDDNAANARRIHRAGSPVEAWIVPADEERTIAADAMAVLRDGAS